MSKHRHHRKSHFGQYVLAFFLFVMITILSLSLCAKAYIVNPNTFSAMFTSDRYVSALHNDIVTFAKDECKKNSVPDSFVEKAISYDLVYSIESSYINNALGTSDAFSNDAFEDNIAKLNNNIVKGVESELKSQGMDTSNKDGLNHFAQSITNYASEKAQFKYTEKLQTLFNISNILIVATIITSVIIAVFLGVFVFLGRSKQYRSMRNICYSFEAAALFDFAMVLAVAIVRAIKDLVVYPRYLCDALMDYVDKCMLTVSTAGFILAFISIIITVFVWRIKRGKE